MKERSIPHILGPLFLFTVLAIVSYHTALSFGFWKDDWIAYWGARTLSPLFYMYWFHPGSTIQFFLFSWIFPPNSLPWQISGLVLRIIASYSVFLMLRSFGTSFRTSLIGGLFFAVSPLALDAVGWPTIQVVHMDVILTCLAITAWNVKKTFFIPLLVTVAAVLCDPFRTVPIIGFVVLLLVKNRKLHARPSPITFFRAGVALLIALPVVLSVFIRFGLPRVEETTLYHFVSRNGLTLNSLWEQIYVTGNYFNSMNNIVAGSIVPVPEQLSTGMYDRVAARLGFALLILLGCYGIFLWHRHDRNRFLFMFLLLWLMVFYIPNFLSEPRLTMGATHRYVAIAAVGWAGMAAILLSRIKPAWIFLVTTLFILSVSLKTSQLRLVEWVPFRSRELLTTIWKNVTQDVSPTDTVVILSFRGDHPIITNTIAYSSISPFTVYRLIDDVNDFPLWAGSDIEVIHLLCNTHPVYILGQGTIQQAPLAVERYYSWQIAKNGTVVNISESERVRLTFLAKQQGCVLSSVAANTSQ